MPTGYMYSVQYIRITSRFTKSSQYFDAVHEITALYIGTLTQYQLWALIFNLFQGSNAAHFYSLKSTFIEYLLAFKKGELLA